MELIIVIVGILVLIFSGLESKASKASQEEISATVKRVMAATVKSKEEQKKISDEIMKDKETFMRNATPIRGDFEYVFGSDWDSIVFEEKDIDRSHRAGVYSATYTTYGEVAVAMILSSRGIWANSTSGISFSTQSSGEEWVDLLIRAFEVLEKHFKKHKIIRGFNWTYARPHSHVYWGGRVRILHGGVD